MSVFEELGESPMELHQRFADSEYGRILADQPRWDRYKPAELADGDWIDLLGANFDRLQSHAYTYLVATAFIQYNREHQTDPGTVSLSEEEEVILLLTALSNDWGEAVVGDINWELKTTDDIANEREAFGPIFSRVTGDAVKKYQYIIQDILFGKRDSALGKNWDAIERITYIHDVLNAFRAVEKVKDEELRSHFRWLVAGGLSNHTGELLDYCSMFAAVRFFIEANQDLITKAYDSLDPQIFAENGQKEKQKADQFLFERNFWQSRKTADAGKVESEIVSSLEQSGLAAEEIEQIRRLIESYGDLRSRPQKPFVSREAYDRGILGAGTNFEARLLSDIEAAGRMADALRVLNLQVVLTSGSFDMWHIGHARYIELAKQHGDFLIVGVDSDEKIRRRKGPNRPMVPERERLEIVTHERSVDAIILKGADESRWELIKAVRPDTLIVTDESYSDEEKKELEQYCGRVVSLPPQATTSTSARIRGLNMEFGQKLSETLPGFIDKEIKRIIEDA